MGLIQGSPGASYPSLPHSPAGASCQLHEAATGPWKCQLLISWPGLGLEAQAHRWLGRMLERSSPPLALPTSIEGLCPTLFPILVAPSPLPSIFR